jgi:hypothetical protein
MTTVPRSGEAARVPSVVPSARGLDHRDRLGQPRVERLEDAGLHRRRGVPVDRPHRAHALGHPGGSAGGRVAHQLVDHPGRDAVVLQPGREGVPEVVGAAQVQAEQMPLRPRPADGSQIGMAQAVAGRVREWTPFPMARW